MKRGGEGSPKWKRNKRLNSRLFFNIHLIYNQKVKTIHRVNSKPLSLSLPLSFEISKFTNRRDTWHAISLIRISLRGNSLPRLIRNDVKTFNDFLGSDLR